MRHENDIIVYGTYELLEAAHEELYIYKRKLDDKELLVICNFSDKEVAVPESISAAVAANKGLVISNYSDIDAEVIKPYEATVYWV